MRPQIEDDLSVRQNQRIWHPRPYCQFHSIDDKAVCGFPSSISKILPLPSLAASCAEFLYGGHAIRASVHSSAFFCWSVGQRPDRLRELAEVLLIGHQLELNGAHLGAELTRQQTSTIEIYP